MPTRYEGYAMSDRLGDEPLDGWVDDELGLILNPRGRPGRISCPARAGRAESGDGSRQTTFEARCAEVGHPPSRPERWGRW
jgi:hypothetical protein